MSADLIPDLVKGSLKVGLVLLTDVLLHLLLLNARHTGHRRDQTGNFCAPLGISARGLLMMILSPHLIVKFGHPAAGTLEAVPCHEPHLQVAAAFSVSQARCD